MPAQLFVLFAILFAVMLLCICVGSVFVDISDVIKSICNALKGISSGTAYSIIIKVRIPRVICVALVGASLALCGASMQGLLRNPLADGSTLGVSSGASLGAVIAIALDIKIPSVPLAATMVMAVIFAFLSLAIILSLAYRMDKTLSTDSIVLIGVVFSMFATSIISLITAFAGSKVKTITFWTMGSLSGSGYSTALVLAVGLVLTAPWLLSSARELNAFAIGEENARTIGVDIKSIKLRVLICVSILIGICVSAGGSIGFVGLIVPHAVRMIFGANHRKLLCGSMLVGASFLMLADLISRTLLAPVELPVGVVTSIIGAVTFIGIMFSSRSRQ